MGACSAVITLWILWNTYDNIFAYIQNCLGASEISLGVKDVFCFIFNKTLIVSIFLVIYWVYKITGCPSTAVFRRHYNEKFDTVFIVWGLVETEYWNRRMGRHWTDCLKCLGALWGKMILARHCANQRVVYGAYSNLVRRWIVLMKNMSLNCVFWARDKWHRLLKFILQEKNFSVIKMAFAIWLYTDIVELQKQLPKINS